MDQTSVLAQEIKKRKEPEHHNVTRNFGLVWFNCDLSRQLRDDVRLLGGDYRGHSEKGERKEKKRGNFKMFTWAITDVSTTPKQTMKAYFVEDFPKEPAVSMVLMKVTAASFL